MVLRSRWTKLLFNLSYSFSDSAGSGGIFATENDGESIRLNDENSGDIYTIISTAGMTGEVFAAKTGDEIIITFGDGAELLLSETDGDGVFLTYSADTFSCRFRLGSFAHYSDLQRKCSQQSNTLTPKSLDE